jgi:hypothetical protein
LVNKETGHVRLEDQASNLLANDEGHGFVKKKNQDFQFYATVAFVREHLLQ